MRLKPFVLFFTLFILHLNLHAQDLKKAESVKINGIDLYFETYGDEDAEPLFLLHYWTGTSKLWKQHVEELQNHFRVYVPDLRGHGKSTADLSDFQMRNSAEDMLALMDHLGIEKVKGVGVSYGGFTLLHMAVMAPERVASMIMVGAAPYWNEAQRQMCRDWEWEKIKDANWIKNMAQNHVNGMEQVEILIRKFHSFKDDYTSVNFTPPLLSTINAKTLIVMGEKDFLGINLAFQMRQHIPHSYLWILPNAGHPDPVLGKNIPEFLRISKEFLSDAWDE